MWGRWYPCFGLLMKSHLVFKAGIGTLIHIWWWCMCCIFPDIHLWCDICRLLGGHYCDYWMLRIRWEGPKITKMVSIAKHCEIGFISALDCNNIPSLPSRANSSLHYLHCSEDICMYFLKGSLRYLLNNQKLRTKSHIFVIISSL